MLPYRDNNPSRSFPVVTITLIAINVLVFLYTLALGDAGTDTFYQQYAVFANTFTGENPPTIHAYTSIITAMFLHAGWMHLLGNMLYLWIFGDNVEDAMGPGRFLIFYLLCGVLAFAAQIISDPHSMVPSLGASGAIAGVLGAYFVRFPRAQIDTCLFIIIFVTTVRLPATLVLGFWFLLQLYLGTLKGADGANSGGGVAYWAHIGGFLAGMILITLFAKKSETAYNDY